MPTSHDPQSTHRPRPLRLRLDEHRSIERYQRTLAAELLYARPWNSEGQRSEAIRTWLIHYNYHRPHTAAGHQPPASRLNTGVTNVMSNYI
jgi:transposase InsO family protein